MITLYKHNIYANIRDRYATTKYSFNFENEQSHAAELKFEITIEPDAFISKFQANIDGEIFIGTTKEKKSAAKEYSDAKEKDENAILISQPHKDIPNVFKVQTNIDSKSKISLDITIEQYLKKKFNFNEITIQILRNFDKYNINATYGYIGFEFDIFDECGLYDISIPSALEETSWRCIITDRQIMSEEDKRCNIEGRLITKITQKKDNDKWRKFLKSGDKILAEACMAEVVDRINTKSVKIHYVGSSSKFDEVININSQRLSQLCSNTSFINELTLKYKTKGESHQSYALFDNKSNTFVHVLSNPFTENGVIPRRVIFVIDKSGSMAGSKWRRTVSATVKGLQNLNKGYDRFNVILFDSNCHPLFKNGVMLANETNVNRAINYVESKRAGFGTVFDTSLKAAINMIKTDVNKAEYYVNQIIFMTDGEVSNTKEILISIYKLNNLNGIDKYNKKISIFTFGVGQDGNDSGWIRDVNHSFLKSLAVNNNGFYKRIKESNTDLKLSEYFDLLSGSDLIYIFILLCPFCKNVNNM